MKLEEGMICPVCESGNLSAIRKNVDFNYKGNIRTYESTVYACPECLEEFLDPKEQRKIDKKLTDSRRQIDGLLTSEEITRIRKKFGYTQVEFARILRVGEKNFARYESGQATQSRTMDNLLKIINHSPKSIEVIGGEYSRSNSPNVVEFEVKTSKQKHRGPKGYFVKNSSDSESQMCTGSDS